MTVRELLEHLDGAGLTITDWDETGSALAEAGLALESNLAEAQWNLIETVEKRAVRILTGAGIDAYLHHTGGGIWVAEVSSTEIPDRIVWIVDSEGDAAGPFMVVAYPERRAEDCIEPLSGVCSEHQLVAKVKRALAVEDGDRDP
jgi:hypothetical protein